MKKRLEILEAFASSKPTEFDGFVALYQLQHPDPEIIEATVEPIYIAELAKPPEAVEENVQASKPSRRHSKKVVEDDETA